MTSFFSSFNLTCGGSNAKNLIARLIMKDNLRIRNVTTKVKMHYLSATAFDLI